MDYSENSGRGIAELRTSGSALRKKIALAEQRTSAKRTTKCLKVTEPAGSRSTNLNSGPAEADYGKKQQVLTSVNFTQ